MTINQINEIMNEYDNSRVLDVWKQRQQVR